MNLSQEYKVIYMRYKHHFSPQEISSLLDMKEADVRYILTVEANECERQRGLIDAELPKFIEIKPINIVKEHTKRNGLLKRCINQ